jgi:hypothetical protein
LIRDDLRLAHLLTFPKPFDFSSGGENKRVQKSNPKAVATRHRHKSAIKKGLSEVTENPRKPLYIAI